MLSESESFLEKTSLSTKKSISCCGCLCRISLRGMYLLSLLSPDLSRNETSPFSLLAPAMMICSSAFSLSGFGFVSFPFSARVDLEDLGALTSAFCMMILKWDEQNLKKKAKSNEKKMD